MTDTRDIEQVPLKPKRKYKRKKRTEIEKMQAKIDFLLNERRGEKEDHTLTVRHLMNDLKVANDNVKRVVESHNVLQIENIRMNQHLVVMSWRLKMFDDMMMLFNLNKQTEEKK